MTALTKNWRPQRQRPMSHLSDAARLKRSTAFLRYRESAARDPQKPQDDVGDPIEVRVIDGGADGEDAG
jgi:hypothetical protein